MAEEGASRQDTLYPSISPFPLLHTQRVPGGALAVGDGRAGRWRTPTVLSQAFAMDFTGLQERDLSFLQWHVLLHPGKSEALKVPLLDPESSTGRPED